MKDINLLPEDIKMTSTPVKTSRSSPKGIIIALIVIVLMGVSLIAPKVYLKSVEMKINSLNEQMNKPVYKEVERVNKQITSANGVISSKKSALGLIDSKVYPFSELLNAIIRCTPEGCKIDNLAYDGKNFYVSGTSPDNLTAAEFLENMKRLGLVHTQDDVGQITVPKDINMAGREFRFGFILGGKGGI